MLFGLIGAGCCDGLTQEHMLFTLQMLQLNQPPQNQSDSSSNISKKLLNKVKAASGKGNSWYSNKAAAAASSSTNNVLQPPSQFASVELYRLDGISNSKAPPNTPASMLLAMAMVRIT